VTVASHPEVLQPLAARYRPQIKGVLPFGEEEPEQVRAMQVVLRVERAQPPLRTALLEAAAAAVVAVCLDPRGEPGGEWHDELSAWIGTRIRKVVRRARGTHWQAVQEVAGITVTVGDAQARALVPGLVAEEPKAISKLQIEGTELPTDEPGQRVPGTPLLWLNPQVEMTLGKQAAQVGHASMLLAAATCATEETGWLADWAATGYRCTVRTPEPSAWLAALPGQDPAEAWRRDRVVGVRDAGYTEIAAGTTTVLAFP
jgi:peptidyl-tRNA hydrolase